MPRSTSSRHHRRSVIVHFTKDEAHYLIGGLVTENDRMERARAGATVRYEYDEDIHKANKNIEQKLVRASRRV